MNYPVLQIADSDSPCHLTVRSGQWVRSLHQSHVSMNDTGSNCCIQEYDILIVNASFSKSFDVLE